MGLKANGHWPLLVQFIALIKWALAHLEKMALKGPLFSMGEDHYKIMVSDHRTFL